MCLVRMAGQIILTCHMQDRRRQSPVRINAFFASAIQCCKHRLTPTYGRCGLARISVDDEADGTVEGTGSAVLALESSPPRDLLR